MPIIQTPGTYDPSKIILIVGPVTVSGYAEGTFVTAKRNNPSVSTKSGADGNYSFNVNPDVTGVIEFTLKTTSVGNSLLSALFASQDLTGVVVKQPVTIKDAFSPTSLRTMPIAAYQGLPDYERAQEEGTTVWRFVGGLYGSDGGNIV